MKSKENKVKICNICLTPIDETKEYCKFQHLAKKDKVKSEAEYHVNCFREKLSGANALKQVQSRAMNVLDKIGGRI